MQKLLQIYRKYFFWILVTLAVFIPLYPKFPLLNIPKTYVAVRAEDIIIALVGFLWLVGHFSRLRGYFRQTIFQAFLLFWGIGALSLVSALLVTYFVSPHLGFLHWLRRIEYMSLFIMAATTINSLKQVKIIFTAIILTSIMVIAYGFGQILMDFPVISTTNKEFSKGLVLYLSNNARVNSTFAGHYDLAIYLSMILVILSSLFFYYGRILDKIWLVLTGAGGFILIGFTAARASFVATFLGVALIFWIGKKRLLLVGLVLVGLVLVAAIPDLRHRLVATVTVNLMGGGGAKYTPPPDKVTIFTPKAARPATFDAKKMATSAASGPGVVAIDTAPGEPINTTELGVYRSWGIRFNVEWPRAMNAFYKNPLLGTGYSSLSIATDSDYLRSLGETGILGTMSFVLIFIVLIKRMIKFLKQNHGFSYFFVLGILGAVFVLLFSALFIDALEASKVAEFFWLLLGTAWAVMINYGKEEGSNE